MKTYYLKVEARYTLKTSEVDEDGEEYVHSSCQTRVFHSEPWRTMEDAIAFGNAFVEANKWLEQYPGYIGQSLTSTFRRPLMGYTLKSGAQVFISIETHNTPETPEEFTSMLDFLKIEGAQI